MAGKSTDILTKAATEFATAKAGDMIGKIGEKVSGSSSEGGGNAKTRAKDKSGGSDDGGDNGGEDNKGFVGTAAQKLGEGAGPVKSLVSGAGAAIKGIFKRKGGSKRPTNIVEDCFVGVTPDVAFAAWTQFEEFASFTKGVENVTRGEEQDEEELEEGEHPLEGEETGWTGKIFVNRRTWKATTVDYDPGKRLSWKSDGPKGTVDGTITFTAIGDNATLMLFVLEYRSKGPIEWIGNRWRTVGRRMRLDIKHFRRYVMRTEPDELPEPEEAEEIPEDEQGATAEEFDSDKYESDEEESEDSEGEDDDSEDDEDSEEEPEEDQGSDFDDEDSEEDSDEEEPEEESDEAEQEPEDDEEPEDSEEDEPDESDRKAELRQTDVRTLRKMARDLGYDKDEVDDASKDDLVESIAWSEENEDDEEEQAG